MTKVVVLLKIVEIPATDRAASSFTLELDLSETPHAAISKQTSKPLDIS